MSEGPLCRQHWWLEGLRPERDMIRLEISGMRLCAHPPLSLGSDCAGQKPCLCLRCTRRSPGLVSRKCEQLKTLCPGWVVAVDTLGAPQGCQALVELWMSSQRDVAVCVLCVSGECWAGWGWGGLVRLG